MQMCPVAPGPMIRLEKCEFRRMIRICMTYLGMDVFECVAIRKPEDKGAWSGLQNAGILRPDAQQTQTSENPSVIKFFITLLKENEPCTKEFSCSSLIEVR